MRIKYYSNNSGGGWWLSDDDWKALEKAGWTVKWQKDDKDGFKDVCGERWLGALATQAEKDFSSIEDAENEFQEITGQDPNEEGCRCCGSPHSFCAVGPALAEWKPGPV